MRTLFDKNVGNIFGRAQDGAEGAKTMDGFRNPSPQPADLLEKSP